MCLFDCAAGIVSSQFSVFRYRRGEGEGEFSVLSFWFLVVGAGRARQEFSVLSS
jgi:hypothetical protein